MDGSVPPRAGPIQVAQASDAATENRLDALFDRMLKNPGDVQATLDYAQAALQAGDLESAVAAYERLLIINPDQPAVRLTLADLYYRLKTPQVAKTYIDKAREDANRLTPEQQVQATKLAGLIDQALNRTLQNFNVTTASLTFGLRWQSNATAGPDSSLLRSFGNLQLPGSARPRADANALAIGSIHNAVDMTDYGVDALESDAFLFATRQFKQTQLDLLVAEGRSGVRFHPLDDPLSIRPHLVVSGIMLGRRMYQGSYGFATDFNRAITEDTSIDGLIERRFRDYRNDALRPTNSDQTGWETTLALHPHWIIDPDLTAGLDFGLRNQESRKSFRAQLELSAGANLGLRLPAPWELTDQPWAVSLAALHLWTAYQGADPTVDPGVTRYDKEWRLSATGTVPVVTGYSVFLQLQQSIVNSSIINFTQQDTSTLLGVTRSF